MGPCSGDPGVHGLSHLAQRSRQARVEPLQNRGLFGGRDFDKHTFDVAFPVYDEADRDHQDLVAAVGRAEQVTSDFGQVFLTALVHAVSRAGRDPGVLRREHPDWAATYSQRFSASFLHERIWGPMLPTLAKNGQIQLVDKEPHREFTLGAKYRGRFKKHDEADGLHSYRTHSAIEFWQPDEPLPTDDLASYPLAFGYRWDRELNRVEYPVVSLRETMDKALWVERLDLEAGGDVTRVVHSPVEPDLPGLEVAIAEETRERVR